MVDDQTHKHANRGKNNHCTTTYETVEKGAGHVGVSICWRGHINALESVINPPNPSVNDVLEDGYLGLRDEPKNMSMN